MNARLNVQRRRILSRRISAGREQKKPIELIVKASTGKKSFLERELSNFGRITHSYDSVPYISFLCDSNDAHKLAQTFHRLADYRAFKGIASAISVVDASNRMKIPKVAKSANDGMWNLEQIGVYEAQRSSRGEGVNVAVIDTGVDYNHPEMSRNFGSKKGYDFVRNTDDPMDLNGHGTHVAGTVFGSSCGIATASRAYAVRVLDEDGSGSESDTIAGLDWCAKNGIDVVNMSLGSPYASSALEDMCYYLANKGVILNAAAGNDGFGANYPAAFGDPVIAVAAVDRWNNHADFSSIFETNDISAPGVGITSAYLGGYASLSGTSMATPHVTGSVALIIPLLRSGNIQDVMEETADKLDSETFPSRDVYGAGQIRADKMAGSLARMKIQPAARYGREVLSALKEVFW